MQNKYIVILYFFLILIFTSCKSSNEKVSVIKYENLELQMIDAYKEGYEELEKGDVFMQLKNLMRLNYFILNQNGHQKQFC